MKLAVIGGGSTYTPELVDGLARMRDQLNVEELVLMDPNVDRLAIVADFAQRMLDQVDSQIVLTRTTDQTQAIEDSHAVLLQLRVGGQSARAIDESFPLECNCIGQETTGAGGLAKAMRTVPLVLELAQNVQRHAHKDAWLIDFTNPVGIVTRALLDQDSRAIGLCNAAIGFQRFIAQLLNIAPHQVRLAHTGLNHLTWIRQVFVDGKDILPELLHTYGDALARKTELPVELLRFQKAIPSYYLQYFYRHDEVVSDMSSSGTRAAEVIKIEQELLELYRDPELVSKPDLLDQRGGAYYSEAAVELIASLLGNVPSGSVSSANIRNNGALPFLDDQAVIETMCTISPLGATALEIPTVDPALAGLISHVSAYEELAVDAAIHGGRDRVVKALFAHPLIGQWEQANKLADLLIASNKDHLAWA